MHNICTACFKNLSHSENDSGQIQCFYFGTHLAGPIRTGQRKDKSSGFVEFYVVSNLNELNTFFFTTNFSGSSGIILITPRFILGCDDTQIHTHQITSLIKIVSPEKCILVSVRSTGPDHGQLYHTLSHYTDYE